MRGDGWERVGICGGCRSRLIGLRPAGWGIHQSAGRSQKLFQACEGAIRPSCARFWIPLRAGAEGFGDIGTCGPEACVERYSREKGSENAGTKKSTARMIEKKERETRIELAMRSLCFTCQTIRLRPVVSNPTGFSTKAGLADQSPPACCHTSR